MTDSELLELAAKAAGVTPFDTSVCELKASWPKGAEGKAYEYWNEARKLRTADMQQPAIPEGPAQGRFSEYPLDQRSLSITPFDLPITCG